MVRLLVNAEAEVNTVFAGKQFITFSTRQRSNETPTDGTTALETATLAKQWELVRVLIEAGADLNRRYQGGFDIP